MKKIFVLFAVFILSIPVFAADKLSDRAYVSLLTCEPAEEVYERFWHNAIRICDPANNIDVAYNYGIFDFSSDYFILKFIQGATDYMLAPFPIEYFSEVYISRKSTVYEQKLNFTAEQCQEIYDALEENYLPENRFYRYNFVYDNCATRSYYMIKSIIDKSGQTMIVNYPYKVTSYRGIFEEYVGRDNWQRFGIDILIGSHADNPVGVDALIAFPEHTMQIVGSTILQDDSITKPLVSDSRVLFQYPLKKPSEKSFFRPTIVTSLLMVIIFILSFVAYRKKTPLIWLDFMVFFVYGIIGIIVFYLMFISYHPLVDANYNLLWLNPLQFIFAFMILKKSFRGWLSYFAIVNAFASLFAIIVFLTRVQIMHAAFLPLMSIMLLRSLIFFQENKLNK